jgi:hypothetical protein
MADAVIVVPEGEGNSEETTDRDSTEVSEALAERAEEQAEQHADQAENAADSARMAANQTAETGAVAEEAAAEAESAARSSLSSEERITAAIESLPDKIAAGISLALRTAGNVAADTNDDGVVTQEEITAADEAPGDEHWWFKKWGRR